MTFNKNKKPLLLVGLPRGITSFTYNVVIMATNCKSPNYVTAGEILNQQRFMPDSEGLPKGIVEIYEQLKGHVFYNRNIETFGPLWDLLDRVPRDYCFKDVVQPWAVKSYLEKNPDRFRVIYLRRPLDQVRFALDRISWNWSADHLEEVNELYEEYTTINVNSALFDESYIPLILNSMGIKASTVSYINDNFIARREEFFKDYYIHRQSFETNGGQI